MLLGCAGWGRPHSEGSRAGVERSLLRRVAQRVVASEGLRGSLLLSIALVDDATIQNLNRHQLRPLIRFFGDGTGRRACWEWRR